MPGVTLCKTHTLTQTQKVNKKNKSIDSSEMRGLRIASVNLQKKIVKNSSSNKQYNGPPKIDVVGKKHNNSLNHASKTKQKPHRHCE